MDRPTTILAQDESIFFSKLPSELRVTIYALLLISDLPITVDFPDLCKYPDLRYKLGRRRSCLPAGSAAILRVCQKIYYEAVPILYKSNSFHFPKPSNDLGQFLTQIRSESYESIQSIAIRCPLRNRHTTDLLMGCQGLKELVLVGNVGDTAKYLLPYWEGLRVPSIKFSPYNQYADSEKQISQNHYLGFFSSYSQPRVKPLADWEDRTLNQNDQTFKELIIANLYKKRTPTQARRANENRVNKVARMSRSQSFVKQYSKWAAGNRGSVLS